MFVYFSLLNSNESTFYILIKVINIIWSKWYKEQIIIIIKVKNKL